MKRLSSDTFKGRSLLYIVLGGLLPVIYIISLLTYNYYNNTALQTSSLNRYQLDVEKQAATQGYYFLERKFDIRTIADSFEVSSYFVNRSLGMSVEYGLRANIFSIQQLLKKTVADKKIQNQPIYQKICFLDKDKTLLTQFPNFEPSGEVKVWMSALDDTVVEPFIFFERDKGIYVASPCFSKKKHSGWIVAQLRGETLHNIFVKAPASLPSQVSYLSLADGYPLKLGYREISSLNFDFDYCRTQTKKIADSNLHRIVFPSSPSTPVLLAKMQLHDSPFFLTVAINESDIIGSLGVWQFLAAAGALVFLILLAVFLFIRADTKHLVLETRFTEANKQQALLTEKNRLLNAEILKREDAEKELIENEERYRNLFELSSDAIIIIENQLIIDCNQKTVEMIGRARNKMVGQHFCNISVESKIDGLSQCDRFSEYMDRAPDGSQTFEWLMLTDDNRAIDTEINMTLVHLVNRTVIQVIVRDISEYKLTQELLVQNEKMMAVGGLAAGMAHEINNPLGVILQANQNLKRRIGPDLEKNREIAIELGLDFDKMQEYFSKRSIYSYIVSIHSAGERAANIVRSMLDFGRTSEASNKKLHNMNEVIDNILQIASSDYDLKKKFDFKKIKIIRHYADNNLVLCEKTEIGQVILNMIKNAAEAMFISDIENPEISITTDQRADNVVIKISDNGPGISKENQAKIFQPFFTTKAVGEGTGLGLSVSYFIITSHHKGQIMVESELDQGTTFTIELPSQPKEA